MEKKSFIEKIEVIKMPVRILILVGTVILLAAVFIWSVYLPKSEDITTVEDSIKGLETKLVSAKRQKAKLPEVKKEMKKVDQSFKAALRLLPNDMEIPALLTKVTELGVLSNLEIEAFKPKNIKKKGFYAEVPIALKISGTYHDVAVFFEKVGNMERIMNIQNVNMKPVKDRSTNLRVTCDAITYTFLQGK